MTRLKVRHATLGIAIVAGATAMISAGYLLPRRPSEAREKLIEFHSSQAYYLRIAAVRDSLNAEAAAELAEKWAKRGRADLADHYREAAETYGEASFFTQAKALRYEARAVDLAKRLDFDPAAEEIKDGAQARQDVVDDRPLVEASIRVIDDWMTRIPEEDQPRWRAVISETAKRTEAYRGPPGLAAR